MKTFHTNAQGHNINLSKLGTVDQIRTQYRRNAEGLVTMADKAIRTGKKVGGYTAGELVHMAIKADRNAETYTH